MARRSPTLLLHYIRSLAETGEASELSDHELVQRFADGRDEAAFTALVHRHGPMVLGVCRRVLCHEQDAEDVFQAVFLVLSRKAGSLRSKEAVGPWLFGVAHRLALRARRQGRNRREREARVGERPPDNVLDELTVREAQMVLDEELARLPECEHGPLVLCYLQGLTRDEAAQRLGCPLGTLKRRLEWAREALQKRLTRRGVTRNAVLATLLLTGTSASAMPTALVTATVQAGVAFAGGSATGGVVGLKAAALADGVLKSAVAGKIKIAAVCLLMTTACVGLSLSPSFDSQPTAEETEFAIAPRDERTPARNEGDPGAAATPLPSALVRGQDERADASKPQPQPSLQRFLDLQPHANQKLKEDFGREGNNLAGLPGGEQALAGVQFNIGEGLIQLSGCKKITPQFVE